MNLKMWQVANRDETVTPRETSNATALHMSAAVDLQNVDHERLRNVKRNVKLLFIALKTLYSWLRVVTAEVSSLIWSPLKLYKDWPD